MIVGEAAQIGIGRVAVIHVNAPLLDIREKRAQRIKILGAERIELVIVAFAAAHRRAEEGRRNGADAVGGVFGEIFLGCAPPSRVIMFRRLKPVAIFCSVVGLGSRSPASCSIVNWSNGLLG